MAEGRAARAGRAVAETAERVRDPVGDAEAVAEGVEFADGDVVACADDVPDGVGVGVAEAAGVLAVSSSTWRNRNCAVLPSLLTSDCWPTPGTATLMMSLPSCVTCASVTPEPFTRWRMISSARCMFACGGVPPFGVTALRVTVVPLLRSRPSFTLKPLCHWPGLNASLPTIAMSSTKMSAASTASARPGLGTLVFGGATSLCPR